MILKKGRFNGVAAGAALLLASGATSADLAVLQYHHVSNETPASTSTTPSLFRNQIDMVESLDIGVKPLESATKAALAGDLSKDQQVAITFDDAYSSVYSFAAPLLLEKGLPFTIFVNSQAIDDHDRGSMTWAQLKELASHPQVTIGNHSLDHGHLARKPDETQAQWHERVSHSLDASFTRIEEELGVSPTLFAYPYGEYDSELEKLVAEREWLGYGQQSGPVGAQSGDTRLPRFPMATSYGQLSSLKDKLMSKAFPVDAASLPDGIVKDNPPELRFSLPTDMPAKALSCYGSGVGRLSVKDGDDEGDVVVTADRAFNSRRFRYNCTYPAGEGRFYWQSVQWIDLSKRED
ncbi:polysaccharide deacetylase family protein [Marinobacter sp. 1Y8]